MPSRIVMRVVMLALSCGVVISSQAQANKRSSTFVNEHKESLLKASTIDHFLAASGISGGMLIARGDSILLDQGYGWADETGRVPISTRSVFDIGSVTKQFTAAAILKLEQQGKLKTSDTITRYFDKVPGDKQFITIHQLLTHTAGFPHDAIQETEFPGRSEAIQKTLQSKLKFNPGEKFGYSNAGYGLLAAIIEIVSATGYEQFLHEHLWKPAGMLETGNRIPNWDKKRLVLPYDLSGEVDRPIDKLWAPDGPSWSTRGSGAVLSTLQDLYKWHKALLGNKVLSPASKEKLFAPYAAFNSTTGSAAYGYGWSISKTPRGTSLIQHNGGNGFTYTDFYRYVDEDIVIIYFTNERQTISLNILDAVPKLFFEEAFPFFPEPKIKLASTEMVKYTGTYQFPTGEQFRIDLNNDRLSINVISKLVGTALTTFPVAVNSSEYKDLQARTSAVASALAMQDFEKAQKLIYTDVTFDEEVKYWRRTFANWTKRFGGYEKSEVVGTVQEKSYLAVYVMLHFAHGSVLTQFRQNERKQFYVGTSTSLLPRAYRFIPQSRTQMLVYNHILGTSTPVQFTMDHDRVIGLIIEHERGDLTAVKL